MERHFGENFSSVIFMINDLCDCQSLNAFIKVYAAGQSNISVLL